MLKSVYVALLSCGILACGGPDCRLTIQLAADSPPNRTLLPSPNETLLRVRAALNGVCEGELAEIPFQVGGTSQTEGMPWQVRHEGVVLAEGAVRQGGFVARVRKHLIPDQVVVLDVALNTSATSGTLSITGVAPVRWLREGAEQRVVEGLPLQTRIFTIAPQPQP